MSLIIEDGTGLSNASAYVSVAGADSYFSANNNTVLSAKTTPEKEAAILYATSYLDNNFWWRGYIKVNQQALGWPRILVYDRENRIIDCNTVPQRVKDATAELALEALDKSLVPSLPRGGEIKRQKVSSLEIEYFERASSTRTFPLVRQLLAGLFNDSPSAELFRA